ncbi:hypothetical protein FCULG_00009212 [Fusarium culmorum]|uniref:HNH nuclease domain-containing protein n=1 Tax=Fusarium culmorum TaxID=5516 RepID=A0A2T4GHJ6_FUSCU|nr:hypothetical protein FCULG_00009212 [Fusarium culmorum]
MSTLEDGGFLDYKQEGHSLEEALLHIEMLVGHYLRKSHEDRSEPKEELETANPSAQQPEGDCTSPGESAHILPFAWNKDQDNHLQTDECFHGCRAFFDVSVIDKVSTAINYSDASNKYWNMGCIDDQLWSWWPSAYFGLKCLGVKPKQSLESESLEEPEFEVEIQFNWLCSRREEPDDLVYLEDDVNDMREMAEMQIKHEDDGSPAPKDLDTDIVSGHTATISMPEKDALKCKIVLDIHWNIICIAAMSSGADYPELLEEPIAWVYDKGW